MDPSRRILQGPKKLGRRASYRSVSSWNPGTRSWERDSRNVARYKRSPERKSSPTSHLDNDKLHAKINTQRRIETRWWALPGISGFVFPRLVFAFLLTWMRCVPSWRFLCTVRSRIGLGSASLDGQQRDSGVLTQLGVGGRVETELYGALRTAWSKSVSVYLFINTAIGSDLKPISGFPTPPVNPVPLGRSQPVQNFHPVDKTLTFLRLTPYLRYCSPADLIKTIALLDGSPCLVPAPPTTPP